MFLNSFYIQKSKLLLFPLLELPKDSVKAKTTFLAYKGKVEITDPSIICVYERTHPDYYDFRNNILFKHPMFDIMIRGFDYDYIVFNLKEFKKDYSRFLTGKYSKISMESKRIIKDHYDGTRLGPLMLDTHLNPSDYHEVYANEFGVDVDYVRKAHETLDAPDLEKETLST